MTLHSHEGNPVILRAHEPETSLYYIHVPTSKRPVNHEVEFLTVQQLLEEEDLCKAIWEQLSTSFKTRSKFFAVWPCVQYVAIHRCEHELAGFLFVSAPINWQIDYVSVPEKFRHQGIAASLVNATVNHALDRHVPYVMLTSREGLRPLYEGQCGFVVVGNTRGVELAREEQLMTC